MKRIALVLVLALVLGGLALSAQTFVLKVKVQSANVRTEPDTNSAVVKQVKLGTLLEAKQKAGDWFEITVTNDLGVNLTAYIHSNVVDVVSGGGEVGREEAPPVRAAEPVRQPARVEAPVYDQSYAPASPAKGGVKLMVGYGMGNIAYTTDQDTTEIDKYKTALPGFAGGVGFETGGTVGLELDLMYLPKGVRFKGTDSGTTFDYKVEMTQISAAVLLKLNFPMSGISPFALGGGEVAYISSAKVNYTVSSGGQTESGSEDFKEDSVSMDYGLVLGGGIGLPLGGMKLVAEVRYHLGFANLVKDPTPEDPKIKSSLFLIMAGFKF
jgi:opacity protein-like surface antigen